jgi:Protein of unknown function (DUF2490).
MHLIRIIFAGLALTVLFTIETIAQAPDNDFQIWNETTLVKPVLYTKDSNDKEVPRLSLLFFGTLRLGQNRAYPVDKRVGTGFELRLNDSFTFTPTYLYRSANPGRNVKEYEHRIRFDITYQKKWKHVAIKNRDRVEYRARNSRDDSVRFRNKFTFMVPVKKGDKELFTPFISSEPYYDFSAKNWSSHELWAGISRKISKSVSAEFFYIRRDNRTGSPRHINGVGANFKIVLP